MDFKISKNKIMRKFKLGAHEIPSLGFGTWQIIGDTCIEAVETALEIGYRHIDGAAAYQNHNEVGKGIQNSGISRDEIFITSKLWITDMHKQAAIDACKKALDELGIQYLDLYLMHWPDRKIPVDQTLGALTELKEMGLIKEWGISNSNIHHIQDILAKGYKPVNNQVEFHPSLNQKALKEFCDEKNILVTAYSPIAQGADLKLPLITELAQKYNKSTSQVVLNWIISKGIVAIPKGSSRDHILDNFKTLEWELDLTDLAKIDTLNTNNRLIIPHWADFDY